MAFDAGTAANIVGSEITVAERWLKLYRKIHDLFLKDDFTNRNDHEAAVKQINLRIDTLETGINATLSQINLALNLIQIHGIAHLHLGNLGAPTGPPLPPLVIAPASFVPTPPAITTKTFATTRNTVLQATGEPVVPIDTTQSSL